MLLLDIIVGALAITFLIFTAWLIPQLKEKPDYRTRVYTGKQDTGLSFAEKINKRWHKDKSNDNKR